MSQVCTRCGGSGFLNIEQVIKDDWELVALSLPGDASILKWIKTHDNHDVQVCDCCGDGIEWHGVPGEHYNEDDPPGPWGPYAYNGGLCECH